MADGPMSTPRRSWPRSRGAPMMAMWECCMTLRTKARRHERVYRTVGLGGRASRRRERVPVDVPEHHPGISGKGRHGDGLRWFCGRRPLGVPNHCELEQLMEWLERLETLRQCGGTSEP